MRTSIPSLSLATDSLPNMKKQVPKDVQKAIFSAAKRGGKWLDKKQPGWIKYIRIGQLDMETEGHCILGQLGDRLMDDKDFSDFLVFIDGCKLPTEFRHLGLTPKEAMNLGFDLPDKVYGWWKGMESHDEYRGIDACWSLMNEAWLAEVRERRRAKPEAA